MEETEFRIMLHDKLCSIADLMMLHYKPCEGCEHTCCTNAYYQVNGKCLFMSDKGCTTESLYCKTWFCEEASTPEEFMKVMGLIDEIGKLMKLSTYNPED